MDANKRSQVYGAQQNRVKAELSVYYGPSRQTVLSAFTVDVSSGGLFLNTTFPLQQNEQVSLIFSMPNKDKSVSCNARVAWVNPEHRECKGEWPPGVGLQFIDLSLQDVLAISEFVQNYGIEARW